MCYCLPDNVLMMLLMVTLFREAEQEPINTQGETWLPRYHSVPRAGQCCSRPARTTLRDRGLGSSPSAALRSGQRRSRSHSARLDRVGLRHDDREALA